MHAGAAHANCLPYSTVLVNEVMVPYHMQYQYPVLTCVTTITHWILRPWSNSPSLVLSKTQELGKFCPGLRYCLLNTLHRLRPHRNIRAVAISMLQPLTTKSIDITSILLSHPSVLMYHTCDGINILPSGSLLLLACTLEVSRIVSAHHHSSGFGDIPYM